MYFLLYHRISGFQAISKYARYAGGRCCFCLPRLIVIGTFLKKSAEQNQSVLLLSRHAEKQKTHEKLSPSRNNGYFISRLRTSLF
jgi:hypothetical protein